MTAYRDTLGVLAEQDTDGIHRLPFHQGALGRPGFLHGGAIAGLLTVACDAAAGQDFRARTTSMNFVRGGRERDTYARARIAARTSRMLIVEASAWQETAEKPIAVMSRTYMLSS